MSVGEGQTEADIQTLNQQLKSFYRLDDSSTDTH
jgi:hypothetical protein